MTDGRPWKVHFETPDRQEPPIVLPIDTPTPQEALTEAKTLVRELHMPTEQPGASTYTLSVFPTGYRKGDESLVAEIVTLVTMPKTGRA